MISCPTSRLGRLFPRQASLRFTAFDAVEPGGVRPLSFSLQGGFFEQEVV